MTELIAAPMSLELMGAGRSRRHIWRKVRCSVGSFFLGLLGGFTAWVAIEYFARPLARFYAMRARAAEALARYENRQHSDQHSVAADADWLVERKLAYVDCGAELVAFAISNVFVTRLLYRFPLKRFRYYVRFAGSNLQSMAETEPGTEVSEYFRVRVVAGLRLLYWPKV